jgi:uncharacterized protein YecE (DUF72 family)
MTNETKGILRIGTSNIVVPGNKQTFPDNFKQKSRLNYYSSLFNTAEINSTFKKIPRSSTFEKWSQDVPEDFQFTVKVWKEITHVKQLNIRLHNIESFLSAANHLGKKKGCLLVQFPGSITSEYRIQVEKILQRLNKVNRNNEWGIAIEFRSSTWYDSTTKKLLDRYHASLVLHDMPKSKNIDFDEAGDFEYFRFHGPKGDYRGSYSDEFLEEQAEKIGSSVNRKKDVYVYFNNTLGYAFENAMNLKEKVQKILS